MLLIRLSHHFSSLAIIISLEGGGRWWRGGREGKALSSGRSWRSYGPQRQRRDAKEEEGGTRAQSSKVFFFVCWRGNEEKNPKTQQQVKYWQSALCDVTKATVILPLSVAISGGCKQRANVAFPDHAEKIMGVLISGSKMGY